MLLTVSVNRLRKTLEVNILYKDKEIEEICTVYREANRRYGKDNAKKIVGNMDRLKAAQVLEDMRHLPGRTHELHGDRRLQISIDLKGGLRLIFEPIGDDRFKPDGGLDWKKVRTIQMLSVEDTHE